MAETRIKVSSVVDNQLPEYVKIEFPLASKFLEQYYLSLEGQGSSYDLIKNIDKYIKVDNLTNLIDSTILTSDVSYFDTTINVESTAGFPDSYGLLLIDSEIITYKEKTSTSFVGCTRGFSGVTSLQNASNPDELVFSSSSSEQHSLSSSVTNLSVLFLQQFFRKLKVQIAPGFEDRTFFSELNEAIFIKQAKDFYSSKGTERSFEILFRALYGKDVEVIRPREYLIQPSDSFYKIVKDLVVEAIDGDISELVNRTIYQDENSFLPKARGTVNQVEKIQREDKEYFVLSLDVDDDRDNTEGASFSQFSIHAKTLLITDIIDTEESFDIFSPNSTTLDVDSTVGFPQSGELLIDLDNKTQIIITYQDKTLTQFIDCSGITQPIPKRTEIKSSYYAYGYGNDSNIIKFRVTGVLSDLDIKDKTSLLKSGDPIRIKSLGDPIEDYKFNNWIFNIPVTYESKSIEELIIDQFNNSYLINFYDDHFFAIGDIVSILPTYGRPDSEKIATVTGYNDKKSIIISGLSKLDLDTVYEVTKILSRSDSIEYPELTKYTSNVQNVYIDDEKSLYVASQSLPSYLGSPISVNDKSLEFSGTFNGTDLNIGPHPFYTGDKVFYRSTGGSGQLLGITDGFYFVKKVNETTIQLARSKSNINTGKILSVSGTIENHKLEFASFVSEGSLKTNNLEPQKLIRKIPNPLDDAQVYSTKPGTTGILINGVEILNYKSADSIFYGEIKNILPTASGSGYDIINPPILQITDSVGYGASAYCSVSGGLNRLDIIDGGFDYLNEPQITISGGNGFGAKVRANLVSFDHYVKINANQNFNFVDGTNLTLTFIEDHRFRDYEKVIYDPQGNSAIGGLSAGNFYYVSIIDSKKIKLYNTYSDSISGINTIVVSNTGQGIHQFRTEKKKKKIGSITIIDSGSGYGNKKTSVTSSGINTALNTITIPNHGYDNGEIIIYDYTDSPIVGLSSTSKYIVTKIDSDTFKLSEVNASNTQQQNINYKIKQYVNLVAAGVGTHVFNYDPITVSIAGNIGVSTLSGQNFNAVLQPIFRGSIESVHVESGGSSYGSEEILNYTRQPEFSLLNGSFAKVTPIINDGTIVDVVINNPGINYNAPPNLVINGGSGYGALLTPIISNGSLTSVKIISGGVGYSPNDTSIDVVSAGSGANFEANITEWNFNLVERHFQTNQIVDDDGILGESLSDFGLQYFHAYSPRKLRSSILASRYKDGEIFYEPDLIRDIGGKELTSRSHSPIIGWAYDGNPIYGPYGYSTSLGGSVRSMVSGYEIKLKQQRPKVSLYPAGSFVQDYEFIGGGDLDEYNGRFCTTPEYPSGTYAYFTTINSGQVESNGKFANSKLPVFPYFIGNEYKSKPNEFNFSKNSNQRDLDINKNGWIRNTSPYNLTKLKSKYDFLYNPTKIKEQISTVKSVSKGIASSVGVTSGGQNYKVNDRLVFKESEISSRNPKARISSIKGKSITSFNLVSSEINNIQVQPSSNVLGNYVGFATSPLNLTNQDLVIINSDTQPQQSSNIFLTTNVLISSSGIASTSYTGLVTYFGTFGNLRENRIKENDVYQIGNEQVKVLNVDRISSRIRVLRNYNGTSSGVATYSPGIALTEATRKVFFNYNVENESNYDFNLNKEFYFIPAETLGLGSTSGPGISTVIIFSNPGLGITQLSIPTRSLYIKNHLLKSGDELVYSSNGGTPISVSNDGISSYSLNDNSVVYVSRLSSDLIGISTIAVGLGTTGSYVGLGSTANLLYFTNVGSGEIHSFKTNYKNNLYVNFVKNEVTVSTASSHGLQPDDSITLNITSGVSTEISISYNDYNRRAIVGEKSFISSKVDTNRNTITIENHGFFTGQKVIHRSSSPSGGLQNEAIYYIIVVDDDTIKLSDSFYYSSRRERNVVNITSQSFGSILPVNPPIRLIENNTLVFNLSSPTLSFRNNNTLYSAFDLDFYEDPYFKNKFLFTSPSTPELIRVGRIGIDTNASISLRLKEKTPQKIYYKLTPINLNILPEIKKQIIVDDETPNNNSIISAKNTYNYSGNHIVSGISSNTFKITLPKKYSYNLSNSLISYNTDSLTAQGEIEKINIEYSGFNLEKIPQVEKITSDNGSGEVLDIKVVNVGDTIRTRIGDIGFNYSGDYSVRPTAKLPEIIKVKTQSSFKSIGVTSVGIGYYTSPNLVVIDGFTKNIVEDVDLTYDIKEKTVKILKNTKSLSNLTPKLIPVNNSNGIKIDSISFIPSTKDVVVTLGSSFSDPEDFPFNIGDKVLIENTSVGVGSTAKGYNSSNYNYALFTIVNIDDNIGGVGATVSYNLSNYLLDGENPGQFNSDISSGRIIPEKHFPIFDISLKKNTFNIGENVSTKDAKGFVVDWDPDSENLKVSTADRFKVGDKIIGESSYSSGLISNVITTNCNYIVGSSSTVYKGWQNETGFLNNQFQRVHDNDYYQYFSYALKSQVPFDTWGSAIGNLNHTAGFKKFSDLVIESSPITSGISTEQNSGDVSVISDIYRVIDLNCVNDFDIVSENNFSIDNIVKSNNILSDSRIYQDYIESIGNKVLIIDDISDQFNSDPRPTKFSVVDTFDLSSRSSKYIAYVKDRRYTSQVEVSLISLIHDDSNGFLNQYGGTNTYYDLGYFDFSIAGEDGNLLFYPSKYKINDYTVNLISFDLRDSISSIGSTNLGDCVFVGSSTTSILSGTSSATTIVGIASTYRSSKLLVKTSASNSSYHEYTELSLVHDGSNVYLQEYGQLSTQNLSSISSVGLGTYYAYYSGSNINVDFIPYNTTSTQYDCNAIRISIASTFSSGIGTETFNNSKLTSHYTGISSSSSPGITTISSYDANYGGAYCIISIEDLTNNQYQLSELIVANDESDVYLTEFGIINTSDSIGSIGSTIVSGNVSITFTPIENTDVEVRVYQTSIGDVNPTIESKTIDFENGLIRSNYGLYTGTETDVKREFYLTSRQKPVFERYFTGNSVDFVDIENNTIEIGDNFFTTGEKVKYVYAGAGTAQAIGIATTTISGIGLTDKLPSTVYLVRDGATKVKVAGSAENALSKNPETLNITHVGVGTFHGFVSINPNARVLLTIDNLIQSPIVSTSTTTTITKSISFGNESIYFSGITSFFGGDLIKIDDEIMKINYVGFGSTNAIVVDRAWMGSKISPHTINSLVTKISGDYNIVDNTLHFQTAPYGPTPIGTTTNRPDSIDYVGIETRSKFHGRSFIRSGLIDGTEDTYARNYVFDDISSSFNGITSSFTLKSNFTNISGISTSNAIILINDILQNPTNLNYVDNSDSYDLSENAGITSVVFKGTALNSEYDVNTSSVPRGGIILSVGSTAGFGYQPLISAGGTAIVSSAGTIQSISIGNSGSGYRSGIQTVVNVGVATSSLGIPNIEFVGVASIVNGHVVSVAITNPGTGYTSSDAPIVIFDSPLSYSNIPLKYTSGTSGIGTESTVDIVVGQGSSVISFELKNNGYGYKSEDVLTVAIGGTTGIPTNTNLAFSEFQISVDRTFEDDFKGWSVGDLQIIDSWDSLFDGKRVRFPIRINGDQTTIRSKKGSDLQVKGNLIILINEVVQVPDQSYIFNGGSVVRFIEPPKPGDKSRILFYRGTGDLDTKFVNVVETVKQGDTIKIDSDIERFRQNSRLVTEIISSDVVETNIYSDIGVSDDETLLRPLIWCRQTEDRIINGQEVGKSRLLYEPLIYPFSNIIENVGTSSTIMYVESVKTFFDSNSEYLHDGISELPQNKIIIISQNTTISAAATSVVSTSGTISSVVISNGGVGYTTSPTVLIQKPLDYLVSTVGNVGIETTFITGINTEKINIGYEVFEPLSVVSAATTVTFIGIGTIGISKPSLNTEPLNDIEFKIGLGVTALATSTISVGGTVSSISISNPGSGYTTSSPPLVIIEPPKINKEVIDEVSYVGDFGIIVGFGTTTVSGSNRNIFDFYIPTNSYLRNNNIVGTAITISQLSVGDFFVIKNSNVGLATTSVSTYRNDNSVIGISSQFIDGIYQVDSFEIQKVNVSGIGNTYIKRVFARADFSTNSNVSLAVTAINFDSTYYTFDSTEDTFDYFGNLFYGEFSWGKVSIGDRNNPKEFKSYGFSGINTSAKVIRYNPLKYKSYVN